MRVPTRFFLVLALVAAVCTQLPRTVAPQTRAAVAAPACVAPLDDPFHESRMYAMMHLAIHDALNAIDRRFRPYTFDEQAAPGASPEAAVAAAEVLKQFFGTDQISFQDCGVTLPAGITCSDPPPVLRSYTSFTQAADEDAYSGILIGFHFRKAVEAGTAYGRNIGVRAATLSLQPVP